MTQLTEFFVHTASPVLVPALVFLLILPLAISISIYAGWVVWSSAAVSWKFPVYLQYGDGVPPYARVLLDNLVAHQHYDIALQLSVPTVDSNLALGNFMTSLRLSTASNVTVASVRLPTMIAMPSNGVFTFFKSRPSLLDIHIPLFEAFAPRVSNIVANIELGRQDGWKSLGNGQGREVSVISASLNGSVKYRGIRGLVTRFPLVFAILSAIIFLVILLSIIATCVLPTIRWNAPGPAVTEKPYVEASAADSSDEEEKPLRRRRRRGRGANKSISSTRHEASQEVKAESSDAGASSLRRRQSSIKSEETET